VRPKSDRREAQSAAKVKAKVTQNVKQRCRSRWPGRGRCDGSRAERKLVLWVDGKKLRRWRSEGLAVAVQTDGLATSTTSLKVKAATANPNIRPDIRLMRSSECVERWQKATRVRGKVWEEKLAQCRSEKSWVSKDRHPFS
jgi:hypothetical protein